MDVSLYKISVFPASPRGVVYFRSVRRSPAADGQVEDYALAEDQLRVIPKRHRAGRVDDEDGYLAENEKRFFVQPLVDKALLVDKLLQQQRQH